MAKPRAKKPRKPLRNHLVDYFFPHWRNSYKPGVFGITSLSVLIIVIVVLEGAYVGDIKLAFTNESFLASVVPAVLTDLTNQDRAASGDAAVVDNSLLDQAAQDAANDMANKGYFAHISPSGTTPWDWLNQVGYQYSYAGENLAVNFSDSDAVETAWMNSPTHRENILKPQYTQVGFGAAQGVYQGQETTFVVQFFATPLASSTPQVVLATPAPKKIVPPTIATSIPVVAAASITPQVLGQATGPAVVTIVMPTPPRVSWLDLILASPRATTEAVLAGLFAFVAGLLAIAVLIKIRVQHATVVIGGFALLAFILCVALVDSQFAGTVQLPTDQSAAAITALQN